MGALLVPDSAMSRAMIVSVVVDTGFVTAILRRVNYYEFLQDVELNLNWF